MFSDFIRSRKSVYMERSYSNRARVQTYKRNCNETHDGAKMPYLTKLSIYRECGNYEFISKMINVKIEKS